MILGVALPVLLMAGYVVTALILPKQLSQLTWAFAPGVGAGLCSLIFFIFRRPLFTVELALLAFLFWLLHRRQYVSDLLSSEWRPALVDVVLCTAVGLVFGIFVLRVDRMPHGNGDGWAIWNTHARVLYRNGPNWKGEIPYTFHGDYPFQLGPLR